MQPPLPARHTPDDRSRPPVDASTLLVVVLSIALATSGQLLLKAGMDAAGAEVQLSPAALAELVRTVATSWRLLLGLAAFGASALFWLVALSRLPLSTAYPLVSTSYVLILGFSSLVLGERPGPAVWAGALLITAGVALVGIGQQ